MEKENVEMEKENVEMVECDTRGCTTLVPDPGWEWQWEYTRHRRRVRARAMCDKCRTRFRNRALELERKDRERQAKALEARQRREAESWDALFSDNSDPQKPDAPSKWLLKIVVNKAYGGFDTRRIFQNDELPYRSIVKIEEYCEQHSIDPEEFEPHERHDEHLVRLVEIALEGNDSKVLRGMCVEELELPDRKYWIDEYDGYETIRTPGNIPWVNVN